jgi:hypothetical protein
MSQQQISVKASLNGTVRRFILVLNEPALYDRLQRLISQTFNGNYALKFLDDEEELCTVGSDAELLEAVNIASLGKSTLKLFLSEDVKTAEPSAPSEPATSEKSKADWISLTIDFMQDAHITSALPEVLELLNSRLHSCTDEKHAGQLLDKISEVFPQLAQHPLTADLLQADCSQRQRLVAKMVALSSNAEVGKTFLTQLQLALPRLVATLPGILAQARGNFDRGSADCPTMFAPLMDFLMPIVGPLMFSLRSSMFYGSNSATAGDSEVETPVDTPTHVGINCDHCQQNPIQGIRFKCQVCPDFDLCSECESKTVHPVDHPLLKMRQPTRKDIHRHVQCDGCKVTPIVGARYRCMVCPNFDLCAACEAKCEHPSEHALLKLHVPSEERGPMSCGHGRPFGMFGGHGRPFGMFGGPYGPLVSDPCGNRMSGNRMSGGHGRGQFRHGRGRGRGRRCGPKNLVSTSNFLPANLNHNPSQDAVPVVQDAAPAVQDAAPVVRDAAQWQPLVQNAHNDNAVDQPQEIHPGIWCDECQQRPIVGPRFKCQVCPDYDLCGDCKSKCAHTAHPFAPVPAKPSAAVQGGDLSIQANLEEKVEFGKVGHQAECTLPISTLYDSEAKHAAPLAALESMGFQNRIFNQNLLMAFDGDLGRTVNYLLTGVSIN